MRGTFIGTLMCLALLPAFAAAARAAGIVDVIAPIQG